ncbi:unnamed protein product [Leuciscus chuanchicus]
MTELIQNADDAGASRVVFIHDERHYETQSLWTEELGKYQGPALYAFNDAVFTEEDWEGIQRVGRSIKQDDPTKVGRFGIGFNSVYHITDLPCVFSSEHLAIFDPQKKIFGDDEEGYRWSLNDEEDRESLLNLKDQFQPFQNVVSHVNSCSWEKVISEEQYFKGTLFRFPLRNEASEISDNLYDSTKVTQLFDSFIADADISLLFLRNVSSITLMHINTNGFCKNRLKVSASNQFYTDLSHVKQESFDRKTCLKTVSHISHQMEETKSQWLVTTCLLKHGYKPEIDFLASKLSFYPQVDAAFRIDEDRLLCNGRLSCFLPLPNNDSNKTGLPIHINACFGLTDNRRFIKWQEEDQKNDESAKWNELLIKDILPHVYLMMILDAIQLSRNSTLPAATVYNLWPDLSKTVHKVRWHEVATDTLRGLIEYKIFHLARDEKIWVSPSDAVFPVNNICSDTMSAISRLLITEGENLVTVAENILNDVQEIFPESDTLTWVTPSYVRDVLHRCEEENLSKDDKYSLLEFALSDEKYTELQGLKLLPLSDGTFTSFSNEVQNTVLINNEKFPRTLLPFCKERFIPNNLSHVCTMQLRKLATMNIYNIINLDAKDVVALIKKHLPMDWKEKEELKVYLSSLDSLSNAEKILLSMLPIFRMMSGKYVAVQSKQAVVSTTKPAIPNDLPMPETIVQCANEADRRLLTLLNIELLDAAKLAVCLVDCIETASFKKGEEQTVMTWILTNGSILLSQSEQLLAKTKHLKFIETTHGEHKQVSNVFDPRNRTFQDLFEAHFFPPLIYTKREEMFQSLQRLGLRTEQKEISTENILQVINHTEKIFVHSPDKAFKKAHTLVRVLNENDFLSKFTKAQIEELKKRQWVPCENPKFLNGSICRNLKRGLYKPTEVRDSKYSSIVGYVMPLTSELTGHVCRNLGLHEPPPAEKVLENLSALRSMVDPESDFQLKTELHSIYKFMQDNVRNFTDLMDTKSIPWIWNKSEFVCPGDIVLAYPPELDLSPYIKKVPEEFLQYENLLTKFGVKKTLSDEEIEDILHDIKQRIDCRYPPHGDLRERKVSIAILDWMRKNEKLLKDSTPVPVMAQNQNFTLQSLSKTVFCDISAEGLDDLKQDNEEFYVIHEEVLPITAKWLKVPSLSTRILKPQLIQAEQESFGIEQCGQSEPITQRIKNILKEYDEESDIFKELLQNAEDAGATTCKFLLDFRKHRDPPETLFDHGMALCNGPCLWIFNNELFSQEDWRNIVKVGSASKEKKVEMIGKFGLGFNAVYHVSDIPSILSGKTLLILDPNVTHLEKHILSKGNPGIRLDPFQERLYKRFPGQFKSYEGIFDCDLSVQNSKKAYNGTLIKLPFRTQEEANKEENTNAWSPDESLKHEGQAFCFLPLSIDTGLPVHVNGTFAVTSNRKSLWEKGVKSEWNKALLKDAITSAYITTLLELTKMAQNGHIQNYYFHTFWPNTETVSKAFLPMVESFYSAVVQNANGKSLEFFSNGHNWCSMDNVRFLNPKIEESRVIGDIAMNVFLSLGASYSSVVSLPSWVRQSFIDCGFEPEIKQRTINWPEFYNIVFENLSSVDTHSRNTLVLNAIDLNDPAVDHPLKSYPCIPTQSCKKLQFIKRLVNPSGKMACLYELKEGRFLEGTENDFLSPKRIQRLSDLGMLSDHLPLEDIIERAGKITSVWQQDKSEYRKRLQCLVESINDSSEDVNSLHWHTLSQIPFLPALVPLVQQNKNATILKKPSEVYNDSCHNLVSMTEFTVDHSNLQIYNYDPVLQKLRVLTNPPVETVLQQLLKAHQHCNAIKKTAIFNIAQSCYEYLNNYLLEQKDPNPIRCHAKSFPFIFIEDHFVNVRSVARSEQFEEKPYLYVLPVIFSKFERLWECLGVNKQFTKEQFVATLDEIKALNGSQPLSLSDLHKCVAILINGLYKIKDEKLTNCLIPDKRGVLTSSKELRFNDSPWMPVSAGVKLVHDLIPRSVACHFGVMTTRHHTLKNHLVSGFSLYAKKFGQTEKLTVRINNIIDAYPSKKDILKELIQNADDAQATEIHFVWDKRKHKTEKIFGKKWELVQGPALCVYNNRTFSDDDLQGIQQLGEGGKHGTLGRTGKYGLGFNSVYHLTDCPSILTADKWLCISDPNLKYVEGITKQSPGCMFSMEAEFKNSFEDVYHTFLPEMFPLNSGTMFRLPLRTENMAEKSEISRHTVTDRDMKELYTALTEDPEGLILFLKHITKIQFMEISEDGEGKKSSFLIEKKHTEKSMVSKENFHRHVRDSLMSGTAEPCKTIYGLQISSGNKQNSDFFIGLILEFRLKYMNPELLQTGDSSAVLEEVYHVPHSQFEELSTDECVDLQRFLQNGIRDSKKKSVHVGMLKSLPLFESITGKRERIDLQRMIFILNSKHQNDFPNMYHVDGCDSIFLKNTLVNLVLAECLNIQILDDLEFCVQFILPSVYTMKEAKLLDLMWFLVELGSVDPRIVSALRNVKFIRDIHGSLQVASYFYDDSVSLYSAMLPKERFVPEKFWENFQGKQTKAHRLLKGLGLKHEVSDEEIIQFAKQIESETRGSTPLDVLKKRSKLLLKSVLSKSIDKNSNLLNIVANIKFIFPMQIQQKLCDYHKAFSQEREVVAISGSLIGRDNDHHYLIWTSMPILPSELCSSHLIKKITDVGALETPTLGQIAANLKNICMSQCHTDTLLETRNTIFSKSYAYLQSINFDASLFSDLPIILVENRTKLVKSKQTALVLHDDLEFRPYLYRIPSNYMKFEDFFKKIGVKERPTVNQLITVLQEIYSDSSDKDSLQANQKITVKRVVQQLFCLLKEDQNKTFFQNDLLYLPSTDGRLYESNTLFFNDTVFQPARLEGPLETKLKLLEKLNCCHLVNDHYEHLTLLQFLPQQVRPKFLSDVVSENLEGASVQYCDEGGCEFSGWFDKHLSSAAFLHGLVCLIREDSKGGVSQSEAARKCEEIFSKIQIICCKTLQTELLLNHEPLEGTKAETDVYVKKQQDGCSFYLKHNDDMVPKVVNEVNMCLTKEINALLKNCLTTSSFLVLGHLLLCDNMEDVEKTLSKHGIHNSGLEEGHDALPKPGCLIPEEWHDCLDMNFLNNFESGEYVGFSKDESGEYFYTIVINRLDDPLGQMRQFPARYKIQVGIDDFIEVSSLDLYQFKREKKATVSTGSTCTDIERLLASRPPPKTVFPGTFEEIKREIDQSLNEIWNMSSEDKQKALKRLYLRWHPDKNPGNEELANEAFKYMQNRIEELQHGKTAHSTSSTWRDFRDFYDTWNTEARSHRRGRERFYQNYSRRHYNFWSYHRETPRPNRGEAKRWYEQAQCDISAAHNDTGGDCSEWCLFKVHQAVEKSLIAAMYRRSGEHPNNCSITSLAQQVSHYSSQLTSLPNTVRQLTELGVDGKKTQYPNFHPLPHIPNKQFSFDNARSALDIATKLLEKIEEYIS